MLDFGGKTLLQRQLDAYKKCGVKDISLIRGYKKKKLIIKVLNTLKILIIKITIF